MRTRHDDSLVHGTAGAPVRLLGLIWALGCVPLCGCAPDEEAEAQDSDGTAEVTSARTEWPEQVYCVACKDGWKFGHDENRTMQEAKVYLQNIQTGETWVVKLGHPVKVEPTFIEYEDKLLPAGGAIRSIVLSIADSPLFKFRYFRTWTVRYRHELLTAGGAVRLIDAETVCQGVDVWGCINGDRAACQKTVDASCRQD
jgi:hypothetical protein